MARRLIQALSFWPSLPHYFLSHLYLTTPRPHTHAHTTALHCRQLGETDAVAALHHVLKDRAVTDRIVTPVCDCLKALCVNDDICKKLGSEGGIETVVTMLDANLGEPRVAYSLASLLRQLCGNDDNKTRAVDRGLLPVLLKGLRAYKEGNASVAEILLGLLAALTLRNVEGSAMAADLGAFDVIAEVMSEQAGSAPVQRQACMAIRNMVVRNVELRPLALSKGLEALIRTARGKFAKACDDVGSAALRDLGLEEYK